jgi:pyruvate dehydrogenase E2 component (dihydrolipoamide acetyltransferase)
MSNLSRRLSRNSRLLVEMNYLSNILFLLFCFQIDFRCIVNFGQTMESGTIASWSIKEGDTFNAGDVVCSIETDKATVDFEAQDSGILAKILTQAGTPDIPCGFPIMVTVEDPGDVPAFHNFSLDASTSAAATPNVDVATAAETTPEPAVVSSPAPTIKSSPTPSGGKVIASPLAHMLAKDMGYDVSQILGTGPGGRIIAADVKEYSPSSQVVEPPAIVQAVSTPSQPAGTVDPTAMAPAPIVGSGYTDYPLSNHARELAARLTQSKRNVPHYYLTIDLCMDPLIELRKTLNANVPDDEKKIGVYELLLKATAASMKAVPSVNASWMDSVVRVYDSVDINVAIGNGDALYTPVLSDVGRRGVQSLSSDLKSAMTVVEAANPEFTSNFSSVGTITVINLGMFGIKSCAPIVREPQASALALGAMENRIVPSNDESLYKQSVMMTATMSLDHRVVDGAVGAQWLAAFKSHVENPTTLLL